MLYFIRSGQYVKIGVSARPWARLAEFQTANPEPLEMLAIGPGDFGFESELHRLFGEHRGAGEWFHDNERIRAVVAFMRDTFPELQQESVAISPATVAEPEGEEDSDEWRVERRSYRKANGTLSIYENYRKRHVTYDPLTGRQRVAYRRAIDIPESHDYAPDELPTGPRTLEELDSMATKTWRIETSVNGGGTHAWGWRKRGPVREYRYGGLVLAAPPSHAGAAEEQQP